MTIAALSRPVLPDDILSAVLTLAARHRGDPRFTFRAHDSIMQGVFRDLTGRFESLRAYFVFSDSGPEPYSPALNDAFARLQLAGLIGRQNPDYEYVFLRPAADEYYESELKPRLTPDLQAQLDEIAKAFAERTV
jgi:hypothetical protein